MNAQNLELARALADGARGAQQRPEGGEAMTVRAVYRMIEQRAQAV
jgi:hypothetical protein